MACSRTIMFVIITSIKLYHLMFHANALSTALLLLRELDILSDQVDNHLLKRPGLDVELLLGLARVALQDDTIRVAVGWEQATLDCLGEVLLSESVRVVPL